MLIFGKNLGIAILQFIIEHSHTKRVMQYISSVLLVLLSNLMDSSNSGYNYGNRCSQLHVIFSITTPCVTGSGRETCTHTTTLMWQAQGGKRFDTHHHHPSLAHTFDNLVKALLHQLHRELLWQEIELEMTRKKSLPTEHRYSVVQKHCLVTI